ncbi:MAG TPA: glycerophosphodiester phosphodiesterase family protein [Candidatus Sumerlaeota bacterium]|nr:MAG: Glycerophosphoryl diester phosphodiesterase [candidate division BRC1 bacterium ADurb.Bin183]HOE63083.1 glycerophosphodiester phosphodiesterase family protein [Candidatus Sumerlaeota bacterium]HRR30143.1 glycerophosphodiester phosphodiesterase family protein [Candidatus Sumerlaeia bacterium]HON51465.1 glycerophosphodiester phosphodiesterase family protein [Candidatus Sumerlaeota bacterium]HOR65328.1 glycerophosphodiester phosphodiesterase family protein [Candidatus Sumerlaeota bacterium]
MKIFAFIAVPIFTFAGIIPLGAIPQIIAHRGASYEAPENTVAAVELGYQETDTCEIDIWLTKDKKIVVMHDDNTSRITGKNFDVTKSNYNDFASLDAGSWKNEKYKGEKIPLLEDVLAKVKGNNKIFIEVKSNLEILPHLAKIITNHPMKKNFIIIGFNYDTMKHSKALMPEFPTYWLGYPKKNEKTKELIPYGDDLIEKAKAANLDGLNLHYNTLTKEYVDKTHKAGLGMYVWTVDDPQIAIKLHNMGVDGITTNKPRFIRELLEKNN